MGPGRLWFMVSGMRWAALIGELRICQGKRDRRLRLQCGLGACGKNRTHRCAPGFFRFSKNTFCTFGTCDSKRAACAPFPMAHCVRTNRPHAEIFCVEGLFSTRSRSTIKPYPSGGLGYLNSDTEHGKQYRLSETMRRSAAVSCFVPMAIDQTNVCAGDSSANMPEGKDAGITLSLVILGPNTILGRGSRQLSENTPGFG